MSVLKVADILQNGIVELNAIAKEHDLSFGDTGTDEAIATTFKRFLIDLTSKKPNYEFISDDAEEVAAVTKQVTKILTKMAKNINDWMPETDTSGESFIVDWIVDSFYDAFHFPE